MMEQLNIISYNCRGLPRHANRLFERPTVVSLIDNNDYHILCLQETWFSKQDFGNLNSLHRNFHGAGAATVDYQDSLCYGHPPGGVDILWRNEYDRYVTPIDFSFDWLTGIMLKYGNKSHAILCVYMPCMAAASANDDRFLEYLGILLATIEELECTCVSIIGDWNADVSNGNHQFGNYLNEFCRDTGYWSQWYF